VGKMRTANDSPALKEQSKHYPSSWKGKVPKRVRMTTTVRTDVPLPPFLTAERDLEGDVWVNSHGAVSILLEKGALGLKPYEFEIIEWHEQGGKK